MEVGIPTRITASVRPPATSSTPPRTCDPRASPPTTDAPVATSDAPITTSDGISVPTASPVATAGTDTGARETDIKYGELVLCLCKESGREWCRDVCAWSGQRTRHACSTHQHTCPTHQHTCPTCCQGRAGTVPRVVEESRRAGTGAEPLEAAEGSGAHPAGGSQLTSKVAAASVAGTPHVAAATTEERPCPTVTVVAVHSRHRCPQVRTSNICRTRTLPPLIIVASEPLHQAAAPATAAADRYDEVAVPSVHRGPQVRGQELGRDRWGCGVRPRRRGRQCHHASRWRCAG